MDNRATFRFVSAAVGIAVVVAVIFVASRSLREGSKVTPPEPQKRVLENQGSARAEKEPAAATSLPPETETEPAGPDESVAAAPASPEPPQPGAELTPNRLVLDRIDVKPGPENLVATMRFKPERAGPLGELALVVRLPKNEEPRILQLEPTGSATYTGVVGRVSENGKFAIFQGVPDDGADDLGFSLSVSGPATADVRGTCGLEAFQLKIRADGASTSAPAY